MTPVQLLSDWVAKKHDGQMVKLTAEPYFNHVLAVAEMVKPISLLAYEVGLCHDLLEDTNTTTAELTGALLEFGYTDNEAKLITSSVVELTDVFTAAAYPNWKKNKRKKREAERLLSITPIAQTVKYADLIYNIDWVIKHDKKHMQRYLEKKQVLLNNMTSGDQVLRQRALNDIQKALVVQ